MPNVQYFLGANSPAGFYSLYDQLLDPAAAHAIYLLKGGPGCGKSSLLRRVAAHAEAAGYSVEYIPCSGDPGSLDAIHIPNLKTALADATAPHVMEPTYPGVVEEYVNLGDCYDKAALGDIRAEIMNCMAGYKGCYKRAYRCLGAAAEIGEDLRAILETDELTAKIARRAKGIIAREFKKSGATGTVTQRFLGAITCQGQITLFDTVEAQCKRVYQLSDTYGLAHSLLSHLLTGALSAGYDVVACPCPMAPDRLEHLLIPALSLAFVSSTPTAPWPSPPYRHLRLDAMTDPELARRNKARLRFSRKVSAALMDEATDSLAQAKVMHDQLEALYNPHVDFKRVYTMADALAEKILD